MKLHTLTLALLAGGGFILSTVANATILENNQGDGITHFIIGGVVSPEIYGSKSTYKYLYGDPDGNMTHIKDYFDALDKDELTNKEGFNLHPDVENNAIFFRLRRRINDTDAVSGTVILAPNGNGLADIAPLWGLNYAREDLGDITVGHIANPINPQFTDTYSPFTIVNRGNAINGAAVTFSKYSNFALQGFYSVPTGVDARRSDRTIQKGHGIGGEYTYIISPTHKVKVDLGYTNYERKANFALAQVVTGENIDFPVKEHNYGGALTYTYGNWRTTLDAGYRKGKLPNAPYVTATEAKNIGLQVAYKVTPRFEVAATYGAQRYNAKESSPARILQYLRLSPQRLIRPREQYVFDTVDKQKVRLDAEYQISSNLSLKGQVSYELIENYAPTGKFSERTHLNYGGGLTYIF